MNSDKLNEWLQVIGLFGIIALLIFVGFEMRQAKQIAMANAYQARADTTIEFVALISTDPVFRSGLIKQGAGEVDSMTANERFSLGGIAFANLILYENVHHQYVNGFITDDRWAATKVNLKGGLTGGGLPNLRQLYESNPSAWSQQFGRVIEELIAEVESERME